MMKLIKKNKELLRVILAVSLAIVGILHFAVDKPYMKIVPDFLPSPAALVYLSGFSEILGAIGLLIPPVSQVAAWGILGLFIGVFPANINRAVNNIHLDGVPDGAWFQAIREHSKPF